MSYSFIPSAGGAVDLSALAASNTQESAANSNGLNEDIVIEINQTNFEENFELSKTLPVLVVVVSKQSQASVNTAKNLVQAAHEKAGSVRLAVLDVDSQPELVQMLGISQVPFTLLLIGGRLLPVTDQEITQDEVGSVVEQILQIAGSQGISGKIKTQENNTEPEIPEFELKALQALSNQDFDEATQIYTERLREAPGDTIAKTGILRTQWQQRLMGITAEVLKLANSDSNNLQAQLKAADFELAQGEVEPSFSRLLDFFQRSTDVEEKEIVRIRLVELFEIVGACAEVTKARKRLATLIF